MGKINISFLKNKLFLVGFITGVVITAVVFLLVISSNYPPPAKEKLTGTMSEPLWVPSVGEVGVVVASGNYCNYMYCDVVFNNDPNNSVIRCHSSVPSSPSLEALVISSDNGEFCQGGGITVSINPASN